MLNSTHKKEQKHTKNGDKESIAQMNEQCCIWQNNGKLEKQN